MRPESPEKESCQGQEHGVPDHNTDGNFSTKINASAVWRDNAVNKL